MRRNKKLHALLIAMVVALATIIPTMAFASGRPQPPQRKPSVTTMKPTSNKPMTAMQQKIHQNSMAAKMQQNRVMNRTVNQMHREQVRSQFRPGGIYHPTHSTTTYVNEIVMNAIPILMNKVIFTNQTNAQYIVVQPQVQQLNIPKVVKIKEVQW